MLRRRAEKKQSAIIVVEGNKAITDKKALATQWKSVLDVVGQENEVLVLTLLYGNAPVPSSYADLCSVEQREGINQPYIKFLHHEITRRRKTYIDIFRPFYLRCRSYGLKFEEKIAAGFTPKDIIMEEMNNTKATWIIMDRCFADDQSFQLSSRGDYTISLMSDDKESVLHDYLLGQEGPESSVTYEVKPNLTYQSPAVCSSVSLLCQTCPASLSSASRGEEDSLMSEKYGESETMRKGKACIEGASLHKNENSRKILDPDFVLGMPLELRWEVIEDITIGFKSRLIGEQNPSAYAGLLDDQHSCVLVRRFIGNFGGLVEAEKKAALCMHHKNILGLIGYYKSEKTIILVSPYASRGTLEKNLFGFKGKLVLTFQDKMKIAIGVAQGVRYMHQECPRGPVVHGGLLASNILLRHDFHPLISGFGQAIWLHLRKGFQLENRCQLKDLLDQDLMTLVKSDIQSFGILLLRLFCRSSAPEDDKTLIQWARPLIFERAFPLLLDVGLEDVDPHGIYKVMCAAAYCTIPNPELRPCMSEVLSILKEDKFCSM